MLLLDEPFGALDAKVRKELRLWLRRVHDETGVTTIFVTHDQEEAMDLADRVAVLRDGRWPAHLVRPTISSSSSTFAWISSFGRLRIWRPKAMFWLTLICVNAA